VNNTIQNEIEDTTSMQHRFAKQRQFMATLPLPTLPGKLVRWAPKHEH